MLGHPSKPELLAYAEGLVDRRSISAATARHMSSCPVCTREVAAIRSSIEFAASANTLNPSEDSVSRILIAARSERKATRRARGGTPALVFKGLAYAAGVAMSAVGFRPLENPWTVFPRRVRIPQLLERRRKIAHNRTDQDVYSGRGSRTKPSPRTGRDIKRAKYKPPTPNGRPHAPRCS